MSQTPRRAQKSSWWCWSWRPPPDDLIDEAKALSLLCRPECVALHAGLCAQLTSLRLLKSVAAWQAVPTAWRTYVGNGLLRVLVVQPVQLLP